MHVSLTKELESAINQKVESGLYNNASEVVREALRIMLKNEELQKFKLQALRENISSALSEADQGQFYAGDVPSLIKTLKVK